MASKDSREYFAWAYGQQARKDGRPREVPDAWKDHATGWLKGYDGEPAP
ncbi:hypothetical protein [Rhizobiales bacterium 3FA27D7]|jgi:hypothetical protein